MLTRISHLKGWIRIPLIFLSPNSICLYILCVKYRGGRVTCLDYFENSYIYAKSLLTPLQIQFSASRLFIYNKTFSDVFFLGKKTPYPLPPVFYANNVQTNRIQRNKNSWYSDSSFKSWWMLKNFSLLIFYSNSEKEFFFLISLIG